MAGRAEDVGVAWRAGCGCGVESGTCGCGVESWDVDMVWRDVGMARRAGAVSVARRAEDVGVVWRAGDVGVARRSKY